MHYKDGTPAQIGDYVKGTGYNLKTQDGKLKVFVGRVVGLTPGSASCNIQVAHLQAIAFNTGAERPATSFFIPKGVVSQDGTFGVIADREYGQCDAFELVHRDE